MSNIITLSSPLIAQKRQETLDAQAIRKTVAFSEVNIIDEKSIDYKGTRMGVSREFFKQLLKMLGMSQTFANSFEKLFSAETKAAFINRIKDAMASNSGKLSNVVLIVNPNTKSVVGITKEVTDMISNDRFLNVVDRIVDQNGLEITNWSVDPTRGLVNINTFNPNAEFSVQGLNDEVFKGGVTFQNSPNGGFQVLPYVNRLWCTNGLTTSLAEEAYTLQSLDATTMEKFFEQLNELRKRNFAPIAFGDMVRQANNTPASIAEMRGAYNLIEGLAGDRAENWIPLHENMNAYAKAGFESMSNAEMRGAKSNQSVWSVVNGLTHFATHGRSIIESNMQESDATKLMVQAGNIFGKSYDHANQIPNIFGERALQDTVQVGAILN
jgi:hypothetical protein